MIEINAEVKVGKRQHDLKTFKLKVEPTTLGNNIAKIVLSGHTVYWNNYTFDMTRGKDATISVALSIENILSLQRSLLEITEQFVVSKMATQD